MAGTYTISTEKGVGPDRKLLLTCINTGTSASPVWSLMGWHVADSSIEYDNSTEVNTDILGNTYITAKTATMTQSLSGEQIVGDDATMNHLLDLAVVKKDAAALANQDMLVIHSYLKDSDGKSFAERYPSSGVFLTSNGGEGGSQIVSDIDITFGGERVTGTAAKDASTGAITFAADT